MKQKVSFFNTDSAQFIRNYGGLLVTNVVEVFIGGIWVGFLWLFVMFIYQWRTYYKKAFIEDKKEFKVIYRDMNKKSRKIVGAFIIFCIISLTLLCAEEDMFLACIFKGLIFAGCVIPPANMYYGDTKRFKFTY